MDLRGEILKEHSKAQCDKIVAWVGSSQSRFDELFKLFLNDNYRVTQRAAWPLSYCVRTHPALIKKNFAKLIDNLQKPGLHRQQDPARLGQGQRSEVGPLGRPQR